MSVEKYKKSVDSNNLLGAILALESIECLDTMYGALGRETILTYALNNDMSCLVTPILAKGADPNGKNSEYNSPLHIASESGDTETCRVLISSGANVNDTNGKRHTALQLACKSGPLELCQFFLSAGANVNTQDTLGWSPLHVAAFGGHLGILDLLLTHNADVHLVTKGEITAFMLADLNGSPEVYQKLVDAGAVK